MKSVPSLTIASNGINQSILSSLLDSYEKNADMILDIATQHPEKLSDALSSLNDYQTLVKEKSLGGHSLDPTLTYFLALIAFACLSGVYLSIHSTVQLQANLSALGERRSITPTHKLSPDSRRSAGTGKYSFRQHPDPGALPYPGTSYQSWE